MGDRMTIRHIAARQHPRLFYSDIFTPVSAGRRKKGVEWVREFDDVTVTIRMFNQLDVADQDLLLCILAMARTAVNTKERKEYLIKPSERPDDLNADLKDYKPSERAELSVEQLPTLHIQTTCYELLSDIGRSTGGDNYKWLISSLKRLASTSFILESGKHIFGGSNMLTFGLDKETNEVSIHLNALSAHSIWAPNGDYIYADRRERHALGLDLSRALHDKLCARVRAGEKNRVFNADNLLSLIYNDNRDEKGEVKVLAKSTISMRRKQLSIAIEQINKLPLWNIKTDGKGAKLTLSVSRKKAK
ncbi:replication initiator protein A [Vibrio parahaemolyticus]|nr:replication initiator protein A [Vibrio parahaemolyticus]